VCSLSQIIIVKKVVLDEKIIAIKDYTNYKVSVKIYCDLWFEKYPFSSVKFAHPFNPMQANYVHQTLHNVQNQHHADSCDEENPTS